MHRQENKNYAMLGLCMRAGKLITGAQGTEKAVKSGEGVLALFGCFRFGRHKKGDSRRMHIHARGMFAVAFGRAFARKPGRPGEWQRR